MSSLLRFASHPIVSQKEIKSLKQNNFTARHSTHSERNRSICPSFNIVLNCRGKKNLGFSYRFLQIKKWKKVKQSRWRLTFVYRPVAIAKLSSFAKNYVSVTNVFLIKWFSLDVATMPSVVVLIFPSNSLKSERILKESVRGLLSI